MAEKSLKRTKPPLMGLELDELEEKVAAWGEPPFRARQIFEWIYRHGVTGFEAMTNLPKELRQRLADEYRVGTTEVVTRQVNPSDGTRKYLLRLEDGETVETVLMRYDYGNSVCVSTQVGCRVGCRFCASTIGGLVRNLTAGEMLEQVLSLGRELGDGERVSHVVLMGIGEPLENYEEVIRFLHLLHDPRGLGIGYRHVTISTSGIVPGIRALAGEGLPVTLALSLHAPTDALRSRIMPVNRRYPLEEVLQACEDYFKATGRRLTLEYVLIDGVNDGLELVPQLAAIARRLKAHVNLIPLNPSGRGLAAPPAGQVKAFHRALREAGVETTVRRELGQEIDAACGQLRRRQAETGTLTGNWLRVGVSR